MGKKKKEHATYDKISDNRKSMPASKANQTGHRKINMAKNTNKK